MSLFRVLSVCAFASLFLTSALVFDSGPPHSPGRDWDARHFADMVSPFLDMTVKGWTWYRMSPPLFPQPDLSTLLRDL